MSAVQSSRFSLRQSRESLLVAIAISAGVHAVLYGLLLLLAAVVTLLSRMQTLADLHKFQPARTNMPVLQEPQLIFLEVSPAQATKEAPKNPKYYSAQNSIASNTDSEKDTDTPKVEGTQVHVAKTEDTPRSKAMPLQPSPPKEATPPPQDPPKIVEEKPKSAPKPGDIAMVKPTDLKPDESKTEKTAEETPRVRPRTIAQAMQQNGLVGQKMKQDGGAKSRRMPVSFDALGTAFGDYDQRIIAAIQQHWYDLMDSKQNSLTRVGKVVVEFRLNYDGRITDINVVESDVSDMQSILCQLAITDPGPYERWPTKMRQTVGADYREVKFTFYYE
jgi:outer membrane biosynthesis protein TonB